MNKEFTSLLDALHPEFKAPELWKNVCGTFASIVYDCLKRNGIDPNKVKLDLQVRTSKCLVKYKGRHKIFKLTNALSVLEAVKYCEEGAK